MRRLLSITTLLTVLASAAPGQQADCADGLTLSDGVLTIATGNPAYYPWVMEDAPETKQGFEAAVAYAIANEMGFSDDQITWVRTSFDEAIQPGAKDFDVNIQQYSITPERDRMVDFSLPYYTSAMAVLTTKKTLDAGVEPSLASMKSLIWGAGSTTTAMPVLADVIAPERAPRLYNDNTDVTAALQAGQIDAALFDLPTALYLAAVVVDDGAILGQFPADRAANPDEFGLLMEEGNPLKNCVDTAIQSLTASGRLADIEAEWLQSATGVPLIQ